MSDTPERPVEYTPEEGAEVRPASRYSVSPGGYEALSRDISETPYQSPSLIALAALILAVGYSFVVVLGGVAALWVNERWLLVAGTVLVPLLSVPVAMKMNVREPLGLLRVAALALAAFYAGPVGIIGLIAFPNHSPYLLPLWTLVFPLVAIGVGLAARLRIQASEGTLSGLQLTTWAVGLSLFFALGYTAFYAATYVAVRKQAVDFAGNWIDHLKKDEVDQAFVLTLPPRERSGGPLSRGEIEELNERRRNTDSEGIYESFGHKPVIPLLNSSAQANVELVAVRSWGYENGGYRVALSYRVTSPYCSYPLELIVFGADAKGDSKAGRRWSLGMDSPALGRLEPQWTDKGKQILTLIPSGERFADRWTKKLWSSAFQAVNDTREPEERAKAGEVPREYAASAAVGVGMRAAHPLPPFFHGALVRSDEKVFWANHKYRQQFIDRVENLFAPGSMMVDTMTFNIRNTNKVVPLWSEENGRLFFRYGVDITMPLQIPVKTDDGTTLYEPGKGSVEGRLVLSCPSTALTSEKPEWRIESLELVRGRRLDESKPAPGGQRVPAPKLGGM